MRPYHAKTLDDVADKLRRDNYPADHGAWSIMVDGSEVTLFPPSGDDRPYYSIPRDQFNVLVRWYMRDQVKPKKAK